MTAGSSSERVGHTTPAMPQCRRSGLERRRNGSSGATDRFTPVDVCRVLELLAGYENLLRWGDLTDVQVTFALRGEQLADETTDLELAAEVRTAIELLGGAPAEDLTD